MSFHFSFSGLHKIYFFCLSEEILSFFSSSEPGSFCSTHSLGREGPGGLRGGWGCGTEHGRRFGERLCGVGVRGAGRELVEWGGWWGDGWQEKGL